MEAAGPGVSVLGLHEAACEVVAAAGKGIAVDVVVGIAVEAVVAAMAVVVVLADMVCAPAA